MFVNLGYFHSQLSISQEAINDATQQAVFVNTLKTVLLQPDVELLQQTDAVTQPAASHITPKDSPDFDPALAM
jgi:hypothetical protein